MPHAKLRLLGRKGCDEHAEIPGTHYKWSGRPQESCYTSHLRPVSRLLNCRARERSGPGAGKARIGPMRRARALVMAALGVVLPCQGATSLAGYTDPAACAACHRQIWEAYRQTGMARSFSKTTAAPMGDWSSR